MGGIFSPGGQGFQLLIIFFIGLGASLLQWVAQAAGKSQVANNLKIAEVFLGISVVLDIVINVIWKVVSVVKKF